MTNSRATDLYYLSTVIYVLCLSVWIVWAAVSVWADAANWDMHPPVIVGVALTVVQVITAGISLYLRRHYDID